MRNYIYNIFDYLKEGMHMLACNIPQFLSYLTIQSLFMDHLLKDSWLKCRPFWTLFQWHSQYLNHLHRDGGWGGRKLATKWQVNTYLAKTINSRTALAGIILSTHITFVLKQLHPWSTSPASCAVIYNWLSA